MRKAWRQRKGAMRAGIGYDIHRLIPERPLVLGGVTIPFDLGLAGHSDADVLVHAIMDSLLGAAGLKDIGTHFPDGDPLFRNISSLILLERVAGMLKEHSFTVSNVDATIIAENPKLSPYIDTMRINISRILAIGVDRVMVKATTNEGIGSIGKGEGIAAYAVASIEEK